MFQPTDFASVFPIILLLNGIYDILCAYSILYVKNKNFFFAKIHRSMYVNDAIFKEDSVNASFFSYWIFTNGIVRLISSMDSSMYSVASVTYFTESAVFIREYMMSKMKESPERIRVKQLIKDGVVSYFSGRHSRPKSKKQKGVSLGAMPPMGETLVSLQMTGFSGMEQRKMKPLNVLFVVVTSFILGVLCLEYRNR
jgi:hypothetical protein